MLETTPLGKEHLPSIEAHVRDMFKTMPPIYRFHTLEHTLAVVDAARLIAENEGLDEHEKLITEVAAWFHDVGYLRSLADHETLSAFRSLLFLSRLGIDIVDIERIEQCILVTKLGSQPKNDLQRVLCDADMWHLTSSEFWNWADRLRREWIAMKGLDVTEAQWIRDNIAFMEKVGFHTVYGQQVLLPRLQSNIALLRARSQTDMDSR